MKTRTLTLLLTAALGLASAQSATATPDARLSSANVTVQMGQYSGPLSSMLAAIAKAAGYEVVFDFDVDNKGAAATTAQATPATSDVTKPVDFTSKPFNQVWPFLMDLYGLSYQVTSIGGKDVIRVTNSPIQVVIPLKNANATDAELRVKLFFGKPDYSETQQKDAAGNVVAVNRQLVGVTLDSPTLRIVADPRTNSLIVRGTNREIADVQRITAEIDKAASGPRTVYTVKGSVDDVKNVLAQQYPTIQVTSTGKGNQVILAGPADATTAALALLGQIDQPPPAPPSGPVIVQKVFTLANARATDVKKTLDGTLQTALTTPQGVPNAAVTGTDANGNPVTVNVPNTAAQAQQQQAQAQQAQAAATPTTSNGATIIADERTNTLIVRGTQDQVDQVAALIPQLDTRVPLINVQVRIQEISETASRSLGLDWNVGFGNFVTKLVSGGLTGLFDATRSLAGFNIGATLNALETQGLTKRVYDGSVTMQSGQRASGPQAGTANTSDNAAAILKSGGRLELNIPSPSGNITKQIDYGVNLNFLNPQVAADGTITLGVDSAVSALNTAITATTVPNVLDFTNRQARTTVSFKSGQTVMLSGLLGTSDTNTTNGVPFLSSIPVIGPLFSKTSTSHERTQLLIILTGNVVN